MTRQRQNSIHTGFELPVKFPRTSVFSSPQPAAWACQALLAVKLGRDGDALVQLGKGESPSALLSADGEVEARRIQGSFLTSEASQVWKVLSSINTQLEDSRVCGDPWMLLCSPGAFCYSEALKLKCLEGQWLSSASLPSLSATWAIRALSHIALHLTSWEGLYMLHLTI